VPDPQDKALLRDHLRALRARHPAVARAAASRKVAQRLLTVPEVGAARVLSAFWPVGGEVDVTAALRALVARGVVLALPRVDGDTLTLARVRDPALELATGWRTVPEPVPTCPPVAVGEVDAFVVPGLGFDLAGGRLGYGGGHFDRLLALRRPGALVIAPAYALQIVDAVPQGPHDVAVDVVVTELAVHRVSR
jgi:5-formyltetrahydrofolate cyclo-ligase